MIRVLSFGLFAVLAGAPRAQEEYGGGPPPQPVRASKVAPAPAAPQGANQEELLKRRTAKLGKPVFRSAAWFTDFAAAKKQAKDEDKLLLVYFTRSFAA
jgi:hypothetical protein